VKFSPALAAVFVLCASIPANSAQLKADTLVAWDQYIGTVDARAKAVSASDRAFLRIDGDPGQVQRVQRGEVLVSQIKGQNALTIPHGLIHH